MFLQLEVIHPAVRLMRRELAHDLNSDKWVVYNANFWLQPQYSALAKLVRFMAASSPLTGLLAIVPARIDQCLSWTIEFSLCRTRSSRICLGTPTQFLEVQTSQDNSRVNTSETFRAHSATGKWVTLGDSDKRLIGSDLAAMSSINGKRFATEENLQG
jgi:hypothetical protein